MTGLIAAGGLLALIAYTALIFHLARKGRATDTAAAARLSSAPAPEAASADAVIRKVTHDLKAPLAALGMLEGDLKALPDKSQLLLKSATVRIQELVDRLQNQIAPGAARAATPASPSRTGGFALALTELTLPGEPCLVGILDDDPMIHEQWRERFKRLGAAGQHISLRSFSNPGDFTDFVTDGEVAKVAVFLVDHDLDGHQITGLGLIRSLNLASKSVLVTNRDEDPQVRESCMSLGLKLLPKTGIVSLAMVVGGHRQP